MVDFTGGDVVVYKENPGGGIIFDAPGINDSGIVLFRDDGVPYESDSLIVDPQVVPMQTGFWALDEPDGLVVSFSDLSGPPVSLSITSAFVTTTLYGDVDLSGAVNFDDISAFIAVLASNGYQPEADFDDSGFVDFGDIPPFIEKLINL